MVTGVEAVTQPVVMAKAGETTTPAATVTLAGGEATAGLELDNVTTAPPGGAGPFKVTLLPVVVLPPGVKVGESVTRDTAVGFTVRVADLVTPP